MITILGNGPVGLVLERICQIKQWEHQLIAQKNNPTGNRLILLTPRNVHFLSTLGFDIPKHKAYAQLRIKSHLSRIPCHLPQKPAQHPLCYGIWLHDLLKALKAYSNPIESTLLSGTCNPLSLSTAKETFHTDYLFGCDGSHSLASKIANIPYQKRSPYHCIVIPANIEGDILIQKHSPRLILAAIPDSNGSIILSSRYPIKHLTPSIQSLQTIIGPSLTIKSIASPFYHTITPHIAKPCFQNNVFLLGNASLTLEPVAAKGLNHALTSLQLLNTIEHPSKIPTTADKIQKLNLRLFNQMNQIITPSPFHKLLHKIGFYSQLISPFFQDSLFEFGNSDD